VVCLKNKISPILSHSLKPGVQSGPASKKSQSSKSSSSSSQKLLFQKSNSSSALPSSSSANVPSPKSTSQPGKASRKESSMSPFYSGNSGSSSNDMLKNMLNLPSPTPRVDIMKAFDKKFQIPKLSARAKSDDKAAIDIESHAKSAPTTPSHPMDNPAMDILSGFSQQQKFFSQQKLLEQQKQQKIFKSASSEHLYDTKPSIVNQAVTPSMRSSDGDFQAFLRAQSNNSNFNMGMMDANLMMQNNQQLSGGLFNDNDDGLNLDFIGNDL
jgi:hypothetical protein